ncbi:MAG: hypothetical protein GX564_07775 [Oligosphaeraceae bacterium]|nr:hypothetical protein [Oligosphaeraceae bacterium]
MTTPKIDALLEARARITPPATGYQPTREFIAAFRQLRQRRRTLLRRYWVAAAAALLILLTWPWRTQERPSAASAGRSDCTAPSERLAAAERHFGPAAGLLFVNDDLLVFERQDADRANHYLVTIEILASGGVKLARLEFATAGDDYIVLEDERINGRIFLVHSDNQNAVLELSLHLRNAGRGNIHLDEIMALEQRNATLALSDGTRLRVDFCRRES